MPDSTSLKETLAGDIVALTALPARWVGAPPERIADDVAATLFHLCDEIELVQVRLDLPPTRPIVARLPVSERALPAEPAEGPALVRSAHEVSLPIGQFGHHGEILVVVRPDASPARAQLLGTIAANQVEGACRALDLERDVAQAHAKVAALGKLGALGQLVGGVAHELRTPLTYATNNLYLVEREIARRYPESAAELAPNLREVEGALDRISAIVHQLRRVVKHESVAGIEEDLRDLVQEALRLWRATHAGGCELAERLSPTAPVLVDRVQIQQIVINLVQNAYEATGPKGVVRIETRDEGSDALLVVADNGPGMSPDRIANLFQPFHTTKADGLGLGLSIVRGIVQAHHGAIDIDSAPGKGTTVRVRIPRATPPR